METKVQIFNSEEFGEIRTIEIDGEVWFVGKDIAEKLGYSQTDKAISRHIDEDDRTKRPLIDRLGRTQETTIINESGVYSLILSSKMPTAKKFKRWITSEVLPTIRKTGSYSIVNDKLSPQLQLIGHIYEALAVQETKMKEIEVRQIETAEEMVNIRQDISSTKKRVCHAESKIKSLWKENINNVISEVCKENKLNVMKQKGRMFDALEMTGNYNLETRLTHLKKRCIKGGMKAIDANYLTKMDVVADNKKMKAEFEAIVSKWRNYYSQTKLEV